MKKLYIITPHHEGKNCPKAVFENFQDIDLEEISKEYMSNITRFTIEVVNDVNIQNKKTTPEIALHTGMIAGVLASDQTNKEKIEELKEISTHLIGLCME